jgi:hypothetical protein
MVVCEITRHEGVTALEITLTMFIAVSSLISLSGGSSKPIRLL